MWKIFFLLGSGLLPFYTAGDAVKRTRFIKLFHLLVFITDYIQSIKNILLCFGTSLFVYLQQHCCCQLLYTFYNLHKACFSFSWLKCAPCAFFSTCRKTVKQSTKCPFLWESTQSLMYKAWVNKKSRSHLWYSLSLSGVLRFCLADFHKESLATVCQTCFVVHTAGVPHTTDATDTSSFVPIIGHIHK